MDINSLLVARAFSREPEGENAPWTTPVAHSGWLLARLGIGLVLLAAIATLGYL